MFQRRMRRKCCRWRNLLICLCTPVICLALLFTYVAVVVVDIINPELPKQRVQDVYRALAVASNTPKPPPVPMIPNSFWENQSNAIWNELQRVIDHKFNPILYPVQSVSQSKRFMLSDSLLKRSFSDLYKTDHMRKLLHDLSPNMQKYVKHMNKRDYRVLIQPGIECGAKGKEERQAPLILFAIKSSELNIKNRQAIRQTWGRAGWMEGHRNGSAEEVASGFIRRIFLLGKEDSRFLGTDLSPILEAESRRYGDILQWDFDDTFFNLTLKDVLFWSWFSKYCGEVQFILKGDDDVFVNTPRLITYLRGEMRKPNAHITMKDFMVGEVIGDALPIRMKISKYYIPENFYKGMYPMYAGGGGVVYSGLLARRLHSISRAVHLFPIDDVFVGMCLIRLNVLPVFHPAFLTFDFPWWENITSCSDHTVLVVHKRGPEQLLDMWDDLQRTQTKCQSVPLRIASKEPKPET